MKFLISWLPILFIIGIMIAVFVRLAMVKSGYLIAIKLSRKARYSFATLILACFTIVSGLSIADSEWGRATFLFAVGFGLALIIQRNGVRYRRARSVPIEIEDGRDAM